MKICKNYLLAGSGVLMLLASLVLSAPHLTQPSDVKPISPSRPAAFVQPTMRLPASGDLGRRANVKTASVGHAALFDRSDDLAIDASLGDENIVFERKKIRRPPRELVIIKVVDASSTPFFSVTRSDDEEVEESDLEATLMGADAVRGSLLYALAWLAGDTDSLGTVRALGYDIDVAREHARPCTNQPRSQACLERARQLATLLDAALALGSPDERALFRQSAAALGITPDCGLTETFSSAAALAADDLSIDASLGDRQIVLERKERKDPKSEQPIVVISVIAVLVGGGRPSGDGGPPMIDLRATIMGPDAVRGVLLYALAWLAGNTDPLGSVRALGYDINVSKEHDHPCTDQQSGVTCVEHARRLATLLDTTLALGSPDERLQFRQSAVALGVPPDCSLRAPVSTSSTPHSAWIDRFTCSHQEG